MNDELAALAREVLAMFDLQARYFRERDQQLLQQCKAEEKKLKDRCREILYPSPPKGPDLFDSAS